MNYTARVYQALEPLNLTGVQLDELRTIKGGDYSPTSEEAFTAKIKLLEDRPEELLRLLAKLPKQDEPLHNDFVDFLFSMKAIKPEYSYGQLISKFVLDKLESRKLTVVQADVIAKIKGSIHEPKYPAEALGEVFDLIAKDDTTEELIRTLKALPRPAVHIVMPDGAKPDDRDWRISESGMYKIIDKDGNLCSFYPNYSQRVVYELWKINPRLAILKSRQLGISTLFLVIAGDMCIFNKYKSAGLVAQDKKSSGTLFKKVDVILDNLPEWVYSHLNMTVDTNNSEELRFSNGSVLYISSSFRSSTLQLLHISEVSSIGLKDPAKIEELKTGSMQTVSANSNNSIVMESTAKSGVDYFAITYQKAALGLNAFTAIFLSWVNDPSSVMSECPLPINEKYFEDILVELIADKIVGEDFNFSTEQKNFYTMKKDELGDEKIGQEYPTVARESFEAHFTGSILGKQLIRYKMNHSNPLSYNPKQPLYCAFDLGQADYTVLIFFQLYKAEGVEIIHCIANRGEPISYYMDEIETYLQFLRAETYPGVSMRYVFLPHDAKSSHSSASKNVFKQVTEHYPAVVVKKTNSVVNDLAIVNEMLPFIKFNAESKGVLQLLDNLRSYSWKYTAGSYSNVPDHASGSDFADALRTMVMSKLVNSTQSIAKWKNAIKKLTAEQEKEVAILEGQGKSVTVVNGEVFTGDAGYRRVNIADADEFDEEVKHNSRNSTISSTSDNDIQDGMDMGFSEVNLDLKNAEFTKEFGGSFTPTKKDPWSKGWI